MGGLSSSSLTAVGRWTGFAISIFGVTLTYWNFSFNAVAISLKQTFNYTQSEVEVISSMSWGCTVLALSEPLITARFGYHVTYMYVVGSVTASASAALYYFAASNSQLFHHWPGIIGLFQLTASTGLLLTMYQIVKVSISNFSEKHTGTIVGLYTASGASGKIFYAGLIEIFFEDDLKGLFFTLFIIWSIVFPLCALLHRKTPNEKTEKVTETADAERKSLVTQTEDCTNDSCSIREMLRRPQFHLTLWPCAIFQAIVTSLMNNITSLGLSMGVKDPSWIVYDIALAIIISRLLYGFAFDKINSLVGKFILLFSSTLAFIIGMMLGVMWLNRTTVYVVTALVGMGMPAVYSLPMSLLMLRFGRKHFAILSSFVFISGFVFGTLFQVFIGLFYDRQITEQNSDIFCYGSKCFSLTFTFSCGAAIVTLLLQILNCVLWIRTPLAHNTQVL